MDSKELNQMPYLCSTVRQQNAILVFHGPSTKCHACVPRSINQILYLCSVVRQTKISKNFIDKNLNHLVSEISLLDLVITFLYQAEYGDI